MDSDDLSLFEIAGEDDSLLQPIPGDGVSSAATSRGGEYFMCSPLHLHRSNAKPAGGMAANEGSEDAKHSFYRDGVNKENLNVDKAEMVKLSIEPQHMKRKKKGGGYNLRKSLAWDRAFFTEEGVLDPVELSMISGSFSKSKGKALSAIQEEDTNCDGNPSDLQTLEKNLFKKLPVKTSEIRNKGGSLLPKKRNNEAPTSVATRKVLSVHDVNRTGSKHNACPRPVASSSMKRPANLVTTTASAKDSKVSKLPVQKTNPCVSSRIAKSPTLSASDSKHIAWPAVNAQKKSGLKGSSNNTKNVVNNLKTGTAGKSLTSKTTLGQAKRTVLPVNREANGDLEVTPNPLVPSTRSAPNIHQYISSKRAKLLPQTACHTSVIMQDTQLQTAKPSGLRMPSPSLGFFGQSKAPPLQNPLARTPQPSNLPEPDSANLRKLGAPNPVFGPRPPLGPRRLPEVLNDGAKTGIFKASCSSSGCTVSSAVTLASQEVVESDSQVSILQKMEQKVQYNHSVESDLQVPCAIKLGAANPVFEPRPPHASKILSEVINDRAKMGNVQASVSSSGSSVTSAINSALHETMESDSQVSNLQKVEQKVQCNDNVSEAITSVQTETLQLVGKCDTDMKVVDDSTMSTKRSALENPDLTSLSSSAMAVAALSVKSDVNNHLLAEDKPSYLLIEDHGVSSEINFGKCNVKEPFGEPAEMNALSCEAGPISSSQMLQDNVANINSDVQDFNVFEGNDSSCLRSREQENGDTNALDKVRAQSNFEDASMQSLAGNKTVKSSERYISTPETCQHELVVSNETEKPEDLEFPNSFLPRECALQDGIMLQENNIQFVKSKGTNACETEMKRPSTSCLIPVSVQDCGSDTAKLVECQNQENIQPVSVDSEPAVENYNLDAQFQHDVGLHDRYTTMELGSMDEDHVIDGVSAEDGNVLCQRSGHFGENEREVPYITSEPSLIVQVEGESCNNHTAEHDDPEDKQINLSVESSCRDSNSQPEDKFSPELHNSSMGQMFALNGENDVSKHQEDQEKQVMPCFLEADRISNEEKQSPEAQFCLFAHSHSLEVPQKSKDGNIADLNLQVSVHDGRQLKSSGLSLHEHKDQVLKESEVVNCMTREPDGNSDLQDPVNKIKEVFPPSVTGVGLSLADNSAEVFNEENDFENVLEERNEAPTVQVDGLDVNKNAEPVQVEVAVTSSIEIVPSAVENTYCVTKCRHENELSNEVNSPTSCLYPNVSASLNSVNCTLDIEQQHELENTLSTEDKDVSKDQKKAGIEMKQEMLVIKPPPHVTPFSDEWLAAFEAAGEEILTMKSGAVQNSPQDRSQPEPGPWSPVKRKNNQGIGPYDCTKYTNTNQ